jgi:Polysulphide reductase, NrfD
MTPPPDRRTVEPASSQLREEKLLAIQNEARKAGRVEAIGVRPVGAPFPIASPETGYYGLPLLKEPSWKWQIPLYFFVGGAAGSAAVIGAVSRWMGDDPALTRDCRRLAAAGSAVSSGLLIWDLGRPSRFLAMLRIFKPQSPMSVGAWTLAAFGTFSAAAAFAQQQSSGKTWGALADSAEIFSALAGMPFSNYTGVLIGATVIPVWNQSVSTLPIHFGMSGLNSAASLLELRGHQNTALNTLGIGASAIETLEGVHLETRHTRTLGPLKRGRNGFITRLGGVLSGPVPLALRLAATIAGRRRSTQLRSLAAASSVAGSLLTRIAWVRAGHLSAKESSLTSTSR